MSDSPTAYRVLARKYRPQGFSELIGQDAMVQTLANAIRRDRLAHAFLMTGVRGVGKTSTARLIAKALNCVGPDGQGGPTIDPCGQCEPCRAIAEGRHIDIIEMDAASHTGIDDVREIIEAVRYAAVSARYKMYIIDEAHMLSKQAWNGLLKTLEEPPEHVKFLFATTEVNKVPVTVLSRCQRFDLRRIPADKLSDHFARVADLEGVEAEDAAIAMIARAAEGSARDGLSMLDQAIAHAEAGTGDRPVVTAMQVREMLGLSDRGAVRRLFGLMLGEDSGALLDALRDQYRLGVEPLATMRGLLEIAHGVTAAKAGRQVADPGQSEEEREMLLDWAASLKFGALHRIWQLLLKGHDEVAGAAMPMEAAEMALLRVMHAATMPDPSDLARLLREGGAPAAPVAPAAVEGEGAGPSADMPASFEDMVQRLWRAGKGMIADEIEHFVRPGAFDPPRFTFQPVQPMGSGFPARIKAAFEDVTAPARWRVELADGDVRPSLTEQREGERNRRLDTIRATPVVAAALEAFPAAELLDNADEERWSARG